MGKSLSKAAGSHVRGSFSKAHGFAAAPDGGRRSSSRIAHRRGGPARSHQGNAADGRGRALLEGPFPGVREEVPGAVEVPGEALAAALVLADVRPLKETRRLSSGGGRSSRSAPGRHAALPRSPRPCDGRGARPAASPC